MIPESSPFFEPLETTDELELLRPPGEGTVNECGEAGVPAAFESTPALPGTLLTDVAGMRHFAACPNQEVNIMASFLRI